MPLPRPGRRAALGLALLCGLTSAAFGGELFKKGHGDCRETAVQLPAQRVVVQTAAPRVTVQEAKLTRGVAVPAIGTIYMPLAMPTGGVGVAGATHRDVETPPPPVNPLRSIHAAELARLEYQRACALAKAELEAAQRAFDRTALCAEELKPPTTTTTTTTTTTSDAAKRIQDLATRVDKLMERISAVEQLKLIHDNYLREDLKKSEPAPGNGAAGGK
jgi:hypothetical protein